MGHEKPDDGQHQRFGRRHVLKGAAALGALAVAGPALWRAPAAAAATTVGTRWIGFGPHPVSQMFVSWSSGTAWGPKQTPPAPRVRWGRTASYGTVQSADVSGRVPVPSTVAGEPAENTVYSSALLSGMSPGTTYHYSVSNDGVVWSPDTIFTTARAGVSDFRFTAFGDEADDAATAGEMVKLVASMKPEFHVVAGDLAYATPVGLEIPGVTGFRPAAWDSYLDLVGPRGAQSIPWQASVGAHEVEPLADNGYAGFVTRFRQPYDTTSGSPVVFSFTYGNVAIVHLDGNDVSAQETVNAGYTKGAQTVWLGETLATHRAAGSGVDFVVVVCNCCCYSTNRTHGSDGGLRDAWGPLFDKYEVDLVVSGHVHAYERTNPIRADQATRPVGAGGTIDPVTDGTTYICAGGGGNGLYTTWYGATDAGDGGDSVTPMVWQWSGGDTGTGGTGVQEHVVDTVIAYSACRRAVYSCLVVDVTAPTATDNKTTMLVRALMPAQTSDAVTSITTPTTIDSVSLVRTSQVAL